MAAITRYMTFNTKEEAEKVAAEMRANPVTYSVLGDVAYMDFMMSDDNGNKRPQKMWAVRYRVYGAD